MILVSDENCLLCNYNEAILVIKKAGSMQLTQEIILKLFQIH